MYQQHEQQQQQQKDLQVNYDLWLKNESTNLIEHLQMESSINCNQSLSSIEYIERLIAEQMQHFRIYSKRKEDEFVERMMIANPIMVERRPPASPSLTPTPPLTPPATAIITTRTAATTTIITSKCLPKGGINTTMMMMTNGPQDNSLTNNQMNEITQSKQPSSSTQQTPQTPHKQNEQQLQQQQQRAESCRRSRINNKICKAKTKFRHKFIMSTFSETAALLASMQDMIKQAEQQLFSKGYKVIQLQQFKSLFKIIDNPQQRQQKEEQKQQQ